MAAGEVPLPCGTHPNVAHGLAEAAGVKVPITVHIYGEDHTLGEIAAEGLPDALAAVHATRSRRPLPSFGARRIGAVDAALAQVGGIDGLRVCMDAWRVAWRSQLDVGAHYDASRAVAYHAQHIGTSTGGAMLARRL
eukprot:gene1540-4321_t